MAQISNAFDSVDRIYDQRHREHAHAVAQDHQESRSLPERRSSQQAAVSGLAQHMPPITWRQTVNQFAILFGERFASTINRDL
nr:hypothetical protein [Burkholderia stagnalis]